MNIKRVMVLAVLNAVSSVMSLPVSKHKKCPKLSETERTDLLNKVQRDSYQELHWTFWLIPFLQQSKHIGIDVMEKNTGTRSTYLYGPKKCSKINFVDREFDCPTQYAMNHDANRLPENIVYAKCVCDTCRHDNENFAKQCQPVYALSKVLRRNADCVYTLTYDKVPVACTCKAMADLVPMEEVNGEDVPITAQHNFSD